MRYLSPKYDNEDLCPAYHPLHKRKHEDMKLYMDKAGENPSYSVSNDAGIDADYDCALLDHIQSRPIDW